MKRGKKLKNKVKGTAINDEADLKIPSIMMLDPSILRDHKISKLILDLDQTFTVQGTSKIPTDYMDQLEIFKATIGVKNICFLSNEVDPTRASEVETQTGVKVIQSNFRKPDSRAYLKALEYLNEREGKHVAMVGDRLWTDILGANKVGLFTIQVRPLTPANDKFGAAALRKGEEARKRYGLAKFVPLLVELIALTGTGLIQLFHFVNSLIRNEGVFTPQSVFFPFLNLAFLIVVNFFYWTITLSNIRISPKTRYINQITFYFNTYPLFLRYAASLLLLLFAFIYRFSLPPSVYILAHFYAFVVHTSLLFSLSSRYHSDFGRALRILGDIAVIYIISTNIPEYLSYYVLFLFFIPIGTAAKYYGWILSILTILLCSSVTFLIVGLSPTHSWLFSTLYLGFLVVLKIDTKEATNPVDLFIEQLHQSETKSMERTKLLRLFATVMNCEGVYYVHSRNEGYYFLQDHQEESGDIPKASNDEMFNYLVSHPDNIINAPTDKALDVMNKQKRLLSDFNSEPVLSPPPMRDLSSVLVSSIPHRSNEYLIFTNNFTRNGVARRKFSLSHLRTANICTSILSMNS